MIHVKPDDGIPSLHIKQKIGTLGQCTRKYLGAKEEKRAVTFCGVLRFGAADLKNLGDIPSRATISQKIIHVMPAKIDN